MKLLAPIASNNPPVERLTTSILVFRSVAISCAAERSEVLEKHAPSVDQLVTKTRAHFRQKGMLSYRTEAFVSVFERGFEVGGGGVVVAASGCISRSDVDGVGDIGGVDLGGIAMTSLKIRIEAS